MAAYDGQIKLGTKIDDTGFKQGVSGLEKTGGRFTGIGKKMAKGLAIGAAAAATATVAIGKQAIELYAEYEQLTGGIETLFGDAYDTVMENANNAFMTCGMSANKYMEQATSFAAALKQSLGGDVQKAAEKADMAMTDMSDNANKMGTSIDRITDAYNGFAKGNMTMLDNLKLGYGGTRTEMERLLKDAEAISGVHYDISSYADIVDAIHVIQTEMGITGTTALEAQETISGAVNMTKAAWTNLLTGLADGNADLDGLINNLITSVHAVMKNIKPVILQLAKSIPQAINSLLPEAISIIIDMLPVLVGALATLCVGLIDALPGMVQQLADALPTALNQLFPVLPQLIRSIIDAVVKILPILLELLPVIITMIADNMETITLAVIEGVYEALPQIIKALVMCIPPLIIALFNSLKAEMKTLLAVGPVIITSLWNGIKAAFPGLLKNVKSKASSIKDSIKKGIGSLISIGSSWVSGLYNGIKNRFSGIAGSIRGLAAGLKSKVAGSIGSLASVGTNFVAGLWHGISGRWTTLVSSLKNKVKSLPETVKKVLGIKSPSRVMMALGEYFTEGFTVGVENKSGDMRDTVKTLANTAVNSFSVSSPALSGIYGGTGSVNTSSNVEQVINFNQPVKTPSQTARMLRDYARYGLAAEG